MLDEGDRRELVEKEKREERYGVGICARLLRTKKRKQAAK